MLKKDMVDTIVKTLFNIKGEVSGAYMERIHRGYMRLSKKYLESDYRRALRIMGENHKAEEIKKAKAVAEAKVRRAKKDKPKPYEDLELVWNTYCTNCKETLEACPNSYFAEAAGRIHLRKNPGHTVLVGYKMKLPEA